ncbi:MAG: FecR domain-containing protein [Bacteroidia bacterium]|nr:FecR domain-containing protein [Bacteroidia bacterium]
MNTHDTYYPDLITRYLSGEASREEISELSTWIQANPEHASIFDEFRKTWLGVVTDQIELQLDLEKEWEALVPKLSGDRAQGSGHGAQGAGHGAQGTEQRDKRSGTIQSTTYNLQPIAENRQPSVGEEPKVIPIEKATLPFKVILIRASLIAAIALVLLIPTWVAYRYFTHTDVVRLTASNETLEAFLPDGSMISLNAYSWLSYTEDFGKTNRDIILKGEGYFEVNRDSLLPFVLSCGTSRLEVLGTSFFVDARQAAGTMEVILVEGSVTVYFEEARSTGKTIIPGEKAELNQADQRIVISSNEDPNFLAWKTHHLIFLDDRVDMIINTLNKVYQSDISLANEKLASCRLTATFNQQSLESVLNVILVTLDLRAENTSSGIILYGNGCN